jgi:RHS repeat-associated protein
MEGDHTLKGNNLNNSVDQDSKVGTGNSYDFGARMYDSRLGRFFSIDPLTSNYPGWSSYLFAGNNPVAFVDFMGMHPASPAERQNAIDKINIWRNNMINDQSDHGLNYNNPLGIEVNRWANDAINLIENPYSVNQGNEGICGVVSPMTIGIEYNPSEFAGNIIELYENAEFYTGEGTADYKVWKPTDDDIDDGSSGSSLGLITFYFTHAIRNTLNSWYDYDKYNTGSGSTTDGEVKEILNKVFGLKVTGYIDFKNNWGIGNGVNYPASAHLDIFNKRISKGEACIAVVNGSQFRGVSSGSNSLGFSNHYIILKNVYQSPFSKNLRTEYWEYGTNWSFTQKLYLFDSGVHTWIFTDK